MIIEKGRYQLFYSHWCANTLPRDLFWGPEYAVRFIRIQREVDESDWLDEVWAEGGVVVDLDKQILLFFGGEDILFDVPLRRVYLELLGRVWKGWDIRWAYEGIASIADYVGYPRTRVLLTRTENAVCSLAPPEKKEWTDIVASIQWTADQLLLYPLVGDPETYLTSGPSLLNAHEAEQGLDRLPLDEWTDDFPTGGFHIEVAFRTIAFWTARDAPDAMARVARCWPDWAVCWHHDSFEFQSDRAKGLLRFPSRSRASLAKQVTEMLLLESTGSGADTVLQFAELRRAEGEEIDINAWALRDDRLDLPMDVRRRIVASASGGEVAR